MPFDFTSAELAELAVGAPRRGVFFRLATTPVVRLWLGIGYVEPGVNVLDPIDGGTYRGLGQVVDVPAFRDLHDGAAERLEFTLSGLSPAVFGEVAELLSEQQVEIQGKDIHLGYAVLDSQWQLLGAVRWSWRGYADFLAVRHDSGTLADPGTWQLTLAAGSWLTGRRRATLAYYTHEDQKARTAGSDLFCQRTVLYSEEFEKTWPRF